MTNTIIFDAVRTPSGKGHKDGALYEVKPVDLLATLLHALQERHQLDTKEVDDLLIGCANPVDGQGSNIAKTALLYANWDYRVGGLQLNRHGASALEAINLGSMKIKGGHTDMLIAGGIECMSRIPLGSDRGPLYFDAELINGINHVPMGISADLLATLEGIDRESLDAFTQSSYTKAIEAAKEKKVSRSLIPVIDRNGLEVLRQDEYLQDELNAEYLAELTPAFAHLGALGYNDKALHRYPEVEYIKHVHTHASTAKAADGAALLLLGTTEKGKSLGLQARAKIVSSAMSCVEPTLLFTGVSEAVKKVIDRAGMNQKDIELWACHEDFAVTPLKLQRDFDIADTCLNVNGGALALGNPLGASGAKLLIDLLDAMEKKNKSTGLAVMPTGNGMAVATIIEKV
jgi:acetyl-CoA C-acetyltransferase